MRFVASCLVVLFLGLGCAEKVTPRHRELDRGVAAMRYILQRPEHRMILEAREGKVTPSALVEFAFSEEGRKYWSEDAEDAPPFPQQVELRVGEPAPWTVVAIPGERTIRIEAFAEDPSRPYRVEEISP